MSISATHNGTCQICGAIQAANLKTSRLAKHGYTTRFGFFEGTCSGSGELPYELSAHLIAIAIADATRLADQHLADAQALRTSDAGTATWVNVYVPATAYTKSRRVWRIVEVAKVQYRGREVWGFQSTDENGDPKTFELPGYYVSQPLSEIVFKQNVEYSRVLEARASQLRLYAQWQQPRVDHWTLQPLSPRTAEAGAVIEPKKLTVRTRGARVNVWFPGQPSKSGTVRYSSRDVTGISVSVEFADGTVGHFNSRRVSLAQEVA